MVHQLPSIPEGYQLFASEIDNYITYFVISPQAQVKIVKDGEWQDIPYQLPNWQSGSE